MPAYSNPELNTHMPKPYSITDEQALEKLAFIDSHRETAVKDKPKAQMQLAALTVLGYLEERNDEAGIKEIPLALFEKMSPEMRYICVAGGIVALIEALKD